MQLLIKSPTHLDNLAFDQQWLPLDFHPIEFWSQHCTFYSPWTLPASRLISGNYLDTVLSFLLQIVVVWNNVNKAPPSGQQNISSFFSCCFRLELFSLLWSLAVIAKQVRFLTIYSDYVKRNSTFLSRSPVSLAQTESP